MTDAKTEHERLMGVLRLWVVEGYESRNGGVDAHVSTSLFRSESDAQAHATFCKKNEHCDYTEVFECPVNEEAKPRIPGPRSGKWGVP